MTFSQRDGERPVGAGRIKYLRTWKKAHAAGDPCAWAEGRARLMTAEAWAKWARTEVRRAPPPAPRVDGVLTDLGGVPA